MAMDTGLITLVNKVGTAPASVRPWPRAAYTDANFTLPLHVPARVR